MNEERIDSLPVVDDVPENSDVFGKADSSVSPGHLMRSILILFLLLILAVGTIAEVLFLNESKLKKETMSSQEWNAVSVGGDTLSHRLDETIRDLLYLSHSKTMTAVLADVSQRSKADLTSDWMAFSRAQRNYDQIRWLDETGMERVQVNLLPTSLPVAVSSNALQNKARRYYFADTLKLDADEIFLSPFDLNIENNQIEVPYKPTIRLGTPVFDAQGVNRGVVLLNYLGNDLLARFRKIGGPHLSLLNQQGYWLAGKNPEDEWGFMLNKPKLTFGFRYPQVWARIAHEEHGQFETDEGLWTFNTVQPLEREAITVSGNREASTSSRSADISQNDAWKVVSLLPRAEYRQAIQHIAYQYLAISTVVLIVLFAASWNFAYYRYREQEILASMRASEHLLNSVIEHLPVMLFLKRASDLRMVMFNKAGENILGLSRNDLLGKNNHDCFPKEQADLFTHKDRHVLDVSGIEDIQEKVINTRDGRQLILHTIKVALRDKNGQPQYLLGISEDITERKNKEILTQQLGSLLQSSFNEIYIFNADSLHFIHVSDGAHKNLGYSLDELKQMTAVDIKPLFTLESFERMVAPLRSGEQLLLNVETIHQRKDGTTYPVELRVQLMQGEPPLFMAIVQDITEKKRAESEQMRLQTQLLQSQKMESIGHLAGGIAHDFNNMLGAMLGYTELIKQVSTGESQKRVHKYSDEILAAGNRAKELIAQMLMFSSPQADSQEVHVTSLQPALKEVVYLLRASIPSSIEIHYHIEEAELSARIQPVHLHQILMNLLINARDAIGDHGRIDVRLSSRTLSGICASCHASFSGDYVQLSVKDSGSGISGQQLSKIFDPFFTTKEVGKGTGMGLSVVHGIVHALCGHVAVVSEVGKGTTFQLLLPKETTAGMQEQVIAVPDVVDKLLSGLSIMVVDDEHAMSSMLYELLSMHGAQVTVYNLPMEALKAFVYNPNGIDLVITDEAMPDISGFDLAKAMLHEKPNLPILLCTGYSEHVNADIARQNGIAGFMVKPVETLKLLQWIKEYDYRYRTVGT